MEERKTRVLEQQCSVLCSAENNKNNCGPRTQNKTEHWMKIMYEIHVRVHGLKTFHVRVGSSPEQTVLGQSGRSMGDENFIMKLVSLINESGRS